MLVVAKDVAKIDVEHLAVGLDHDVVVMPVSDAQDVGGHRVTRTAEGELLLGKGQRLYPLEIHTFVQPGLEMY